MSLFRSEKMGLYNLIMPYESAWNILNCKNLFNCDYKF